MPYARVLGGAPDLLAVMPVLPASADRHPGTNGWLSCWGTPAHGELAGGPPPRR